MAMWGKGLIHNLATHSFTFKLTGVLKIHKNRLEWQGKGVAGIYARWNKGCGYSDAHGNLDSENTMESS